MIEVYLFTASLLLMILILERRHFLVKRFKQRIFKQKVSEKVEELKKEGIEAPEKRFRESLSAEQEKKKWDVIKYKEFMRQAELALAREEWKVAEPLLIQALAEAKDEVPASLKLVDVYFKTDELKKAEHLLTRLAELEPNHPIIFARLARIHVAKKRYKEAIAAYARALELDDKNEEWLVHLGKLYQLLMRPGLAAECFRRAAELKPRETAYLLLLAESCEKDEDYDNALFTYEKILMLEPYNERAKEATVNVRLKMQEIEKLFSLTANGQLTNDPLVIGH
ncbi:MAG: tetratricopeptide repeat protein [Candidatus Peregrinibacteria bacterium]